METKGIEHSPLAASKTPISTNGGAESGAQDAPKSPNQGEIDASELPPDLAEIIAVWPELPEDTKTAIKTLIQTHKAEKQ